MIADIVLKFLAPPKFKFSFDFCCAIAPRRNKTGVDIIDLILTPKEQILVSPVAQDVEALSALVFIYTFYRHFLHKSAREQVTTFLRLPYAIFIFQVSIF